MPQLYVDLPPEASQPRSILKGFQKTALLQPGGSTTVSFALTARDLSYYVQQSGSWVRAPSAAVKYSVGRSSAASTSASVGCWSEHVLPRIP